MNNFLFSKFMSSCTARPSAVQLLTEHGTYFYMATYGIIIA